ncbi:MAG: hypothetical protein KDC44_02745 [Phaeodactylibacter sp.]|nr:hypothetical protein [Phaeodactylibacter sp.]
MNQFAKMLVPGILLLLNAPSLFAQIKAVTERGDSIYVFNDGTWSFTMDGDDEDLYDDMGLFNIRPLEIDTLSTRFTYPRSASKKIESEKGFFTIRYDEGLWKRVPPGELNDDAEMAFESRVNDIYCIVISEKIEIGAENIVQIAIENMEETTGTPVDIIKIEKRTVNGVDVLRAVLGASYSGIEFIFDSYYYSSEAGTVQFTTWTGRNLWRGYEAEILDLLNGFVLKP